MSSVATAPAAGELAALSPRKRKVINALNIGGLIATIVTVLGAIFWAFPLYWAVVTTLKVENDIVQPGIHLWPQRFTLDA